PYAHCCVLKKNEDGEYEECDYYENGIIVANSAIDLLFWSARRDASLLCKYALLDDRTQLRSVPVFAPEY
ncbi:MAG: hypothetical protein IJJ40_03660, partial [Clostridia bacterium]|nr:hypothetical protein [Clostridia bacterium]